jgi:glycosyltransferase involved in cell wall biosynthesis
MEIVTLSIGRNILKVGSRDYERMRQYGEALSAFHVVVLTRRSHGFTEEVHEGRLHLYPTNSRSRFFMLVDAFRISYRLLKGMKPGEGTLTAQDPLELGLLSRILSACTKVPYTVQVHGDYYSPLWAEGRLARKVRRLMIPTVLRGAYHIRVVSKRILSSLVHRGIESSRMSVLPIRPNLDVFQGATRTRSHDNTFVVLTASRFAPEKNIPLLVRAFALLHAQYPNTLLRIVGEGEELAAIEEAIRASRVSGSVTIIPWTEHIEVEMANADVFALTSKHEAYALVLIESLATGTPVVTTDVGCVGDVVIHGVHGLVAEGNPSSFGAALIRMYEDTSLRRNAGSEGRRLGAFLGGETEEVYIKKWVAAHSAHPPAVY